MGTTHVAHEWFGIDVVWAQYIGLGTGLIAGIGTYRFMRSSNGQSIIRRISGPQPITPARLPSNNSQIRHIFGNRPGHLPDTPANRQLLINATGNRNNLLGTDRYGTQWFSRIQGDGTQVWVRVRNGVIQNGGINNTPRPWNPETGLNNPTSP